MEQVISTSVITTLMGEMIFLTTAPLLLFAILRIRVRVSFWSLLAGIIGYVLFAVELSGLVHTFVMADGSASKELIMGNPLLYILYMSLVTIVFEEGGRFLMFKFFLRTIDKRSEALSYGVCYGGVEAIVASGIGAFASFTYASVLNQIGLDEFMATFSEAEPTEILDIVNSITSIRVIDCVFDVLERGVWIFIQVEFSIVVYYAVQKKLYKYLAVDAVMRIISIIPAGLNKMNVFSWHYTAFVLEILVAAVFAYVALHLYGAFDSNEDPFDGAEGISRTLRKDAAKLRK